MDRSHIETWYDQNASRYQDLIDTTTTLLTTLLRRKDIPYHSVSGRLKERASFLDKWNRKKYAAPEQIMDVAGLRIITHTTAEVQRVCEVIKQEFAVDAQNSGDKSQDMGVDKVGYLSVHYIVTLSPGRLKMPEYERFNDMCFEIQVRSLLQHAWAEIEHDRGYKFAGILPTEIQRKFYLIAGTLELMDQEFCALSGEIDSYAHMVTEQTEKGELDIPIDSTSLLQFLDKYFESCDPEALSYNYSIRNNTVIEELSDFGIFTLKDLDALLRQKPTKIWASEPDPNYLGILRNAMILKDAKKYFRDAWNENWGCLERSSLDFWKKLGVNIDKLNQYISIKDSSDSDYLDIDKL